MLMPSTSNLPRYVIDASVAVKWHLRDEQDDDVAKAVLIDFREGRTRLVAPDHVRYEVPSAILNAVRRGRMAGADGEGAISEFLAWRRPTVGDDALIEGAYQQSMRFGCSLYDALYVALAESLDCPLIHADRRLRNALGRGFPHAIWLNDYVSQG